MSTWRIEFSSAAARRFRDLPKRVKVRLRTHIDALAERPRPPGAKTLSGHDELWRIRVGAYRIVYTIEDDVLVVLVVRVGHRREVYRHLP